MPLTYQDTETAVLGTTSTALGAKLRVAFGRFCYAVLIESPLTADHALREAWVRRNHAVLPRAQRYFPQPYPAIWRALLQAATVAGLTDSSTDADVQTFADGYLGRVAGVLG